MPRKKKSIHQPFEGRIERGAFVKLTPDMLGSLAWKDLNLRQRGLYLQLKSKYREKKVHGYLERSNINDINLP